MARIERMPGESVTDHKRRIVEAAGFDPDVVVGPATTGPRAATETDQAFKERLINHWLYFAASNAKTDDDSNDG
jgi:hypothetical protein